MQRPLAAALVACAALLAACTSSGPPAPKTSTEFETITQTRAPTPAKTSGPVSTGPTKAADASSCPLLDEQAAAEKGGMRLDRISVLTSDGKVVGCRFYPLGHPNAQCDATCLANEHLPPADQAAIEITSTRYPDALSARQAFIALAEKGTNVQQAKIVGSNVGLCFQTAFYPKDDGQDWACTYSVDTTLVLVKTVADAALNANEIASAVASKF